MSAPAFTVGEAMRDITRRLREAGIAEAKREAEMLVRDAAGLTRERFLAHPEIRLTPAAQHILTGFVARRAAREPLPYILGRAEFYSLTFAVTPAVLIPRPETELLIEEVVPRAQAIQARWIIDVGTGSGAIAVVLARHVTAAQVAAVDISITALAVTCENSRRHGVAARVHPVQSDLLSGLRGPVEVIVANLPYIRTEEFTSLPPEVRDYEPRRALDGGYDGLEIIRRFAVQAAEHLSPHGFVALEVGAGQAGEVANLLRERGFINIKVASDYAGIDRVVLGEKGE